MSKSIKTVEDLQTLLDGDLAWRKKEMLSLKMLLSSDASNETVILRSSIALLCAHFEGFIKYAANTYIKHVSDQQIPNNLLKINFITINLSGEFAKCKNTDKNSIHQNLISEYEELSVKCFKISKNVISTHSNPSSEEIEEILKSIGIETDIFTLKKNYIEAELLSNRHRVVHGERYCIQKDEFDTTFNMIMELLDDFDQVIIEAAENKKYMKESA